MKGGWEMAGEIIKKNEKNPMMSEKNLSVGDHN
jgi:hypothetical protein